MGFGPCMHAWNVNLFRERTRNFVILSSRINAKKLCIIYKISDSRILFEINYISPFSSREKK